MIDSPIKQKNHGKLQSKISGSIVGITDKYQCAVVTGQRTNQIAITLLQDNGSFLRLFG